MRRRLPSLRDGDLIGLAAPASPFDKDLFRQGVKNIQRIGFAARYRQDIFSRQGYLAGPDRRRAGELNRLFADPKVKAILAVRGGYGSSRIIPYLDEKVIRNNPKLLIGYSDMTLLQLYLWKRFGLPSLHGPMLLPHFCARNSGFYLKRVASFLRGERLVIPLKKGQFLQRGKAKGLLIGGCLSLIVGTLGTPFEIDTDGAILFFEDTGEKPYAVDRMLSHLKNAGKFKKLKGLLIGCFPPPFLKVFKGYFKEVKGPVVFGLPFGHASHPVLLPVGVMASLDSKTSRLVFKNPFS
ncbi:MAG: LD-carboxypeptidase [Deltaproteobacteria bacterium]|nr:LD-carboxypeptidase [Deltaproteobacteria bacterium]